MGLIKCPRCELNYMPDTERYCTVCKREMRGEEDEEDEEDDFLHDDLDEDKEDEDD